MKYVRLFACSVVLLFPSAVFAQASIAGVVRDSSGAVLPGVTVEAASPALIEKTRTAVTDGAGQFRIVDLRAGTYAVTFTLTGFNSVKREGIELAGNFNATVNADMKVGALEETITVTGAAPVVDVRSARQQQVLDSGIVRDLPTSRMSYSAAALIPGVTTQNQAQDVGGIASFGRPTSYTIHGGRTGDGKLHIDGFPVGVSRGPGGSSLTLFGVNVGAAQETTVTTSGGSGEVATAGVIINLVPREGGNSLHVTSYGDYSSNGLQGSNFTDALKQAGLSAPNQLIRVGDASLMVGGPIMQDRLWYLGGLGYAGIRSTVAGLFVNKNANDPTKWNYDPDLSQPAETQNTQMNASLRLTLQASARHKFSFYNDSQSLKDNLGVNATRDFPTAPDAQAPDQVVPNILTTATWNSPWTSRLLFEAGISTYHGNFSNFAKEGANPAMIPVTEQGGSIPGLQYRANITPPNTQSSRTASIRGAVSYVTGSHTIKVGFQRAWFPSYDTSAGFQPISYRFNNGVPNQLTLSNFPQGRPYENFTTAAYAQDAWVLGRATVSGGVRYDRQTGSYDPYTYGGTRFIPTAVTFPEADGVRWNDVTPRFAVAYDVSGDGKTAVKVTLGKYLTALEGAGTFGLGPAPFSRLSQVTNRSWNDANGNFIPDCDLLNRAANGECGAYSDQNFGRPVFNNTFDPDMIYGWGKRPYNWEFTASVQREILPRVSVNVGYFHRWWGNYETFDNRAVSPSDFQTFSVTAPADSRLPDGGGQTISGIYNVNPAKFGLSDNLITSASKYGDHTEHWDGVDVNVNARAVNGLTVSGGVSTGRRTEDFCNLLAQLPELTTIATPSQTPTPPGTANVYCSYQEPWAPLTQYKALAAYVLPRVNVLVSGTFASLPGQALTANFNVPNAVVAPSLGRNLAGNAANVTVNLLAPGALYGDRINRLDLRFAKVLKYGKSRTTVGIDLYNTLNANPITNYNMTYGARWLTPAQIMPARFMKFSAMYEF